MRVTASTVSDSLITQLNKLAIRQSRLQQQAATGQRVTLPDDDPVAMRRVMDMQVDSRAAAQYLRNIDRTREAANASFAPIKALNTLVSRASELATLADGLKSRDELHAYATEVEQLIQQAAELANTTHRGDYVFAGTRVSQPPFAVTRDANGAVTSVTYHGNIELAHNEIASGVTLSGQTLGANTSGAGPRGLLADSRTGADLFAHLISLRDNLLAGDTGAIADVNRAQLMADEENLVTHIGINGAVQSRLETAAALMNEREDTIETLVSKEADADLAQTLVRLTEIQTAYQAALQSGGSILNRSLLDYIR
jgi:flagellar hook-associated protein 3 FlgL